MVVLVRPPEIEGEHAAVEAQGRLDIGDFEPNVIEADEARLAADDL